MPVILETTFNAKLAEILRRKNPLWRKNNAVAAEAGSSLSGSGTPDILIDSVMPIVVEVEFLPARTVEKDATARLGRVVRANRQIIEQVIALRAPQEIREVPGAQLEEKIINSRFEYCLFSADAPSRARRWPKEGWLQGGVDELATLIENAAISEELIESNLDKLEGGVSAAGARLIQKTINKPGVSTRIAALLHQSEGPQTTRMAMAIIANALTFHQVLTGTHDIQSLAQLRRNGKFIMGDVTIEWERIIKEINYYPIFDIAREVLLQIPPDAASDILGHLTTVTEEFFSSGLMGSHDLYGRMFQRLITDRKFLATFYTLPESAMLLAEIAADKMAVDYTDENAAPALRLADFACGTGTLLAAAYHAVLARHRRAGHNDADIHKRMMEESLIATDIMPAGVHLAVSILSSAHPTVTFGGCKITTLPYGETKAKNQARKAVALGALDLLDTETTVDILQTTTRLGGRGEREIKGVDDPRAVLELQHASCDLVIMNPPFTRPTNHEITDKLVPSFAGFSTSEDEQHAMSARLREINARLPEHAGHGNAGLASNFIDLAHQKLKAGGVLAMVLPSTFAKGAAWAKSRRLINAHYDDITLVSLTSTGVTTTAFSADTAIAEILLIGKKRATKRKEGYARVQFVSLRKRPASPVQSVVTARAITESDDGIKIGRTYMGEVTYSNLANGGAVGVFDHDLIKTAETLQKSTLCLPNATETYSVPITRLGDIADRGLLHRDINGKHPDGSARGPFDVEKMRDIPTYPFIWAHDSDRERSFIVQPDAQGRVRRGMREAANTVWKTRSTLHFNLDFGLSANSLAACVTPMPTIGGRAWPNVRPKNAKHEAAILLWANSTPGLLLWWHSSSRQQSSRARMTISRLPDLPILDTRRLSAKQHRLAAKIFDRFKRKYFYPANEAYHDEVRHDLDRAVLVELLDLPESILDPLDLLRRKWCFEPSVHGGKSTRPRVDPADAAQPPGAV